MSLSFSENLFPLAAQNIIEIHKRGKIKARVTRQSKQAHKEMDLRVPVRRACVRTWVRASACERARCVPGGVRGSFEDHGEGSLGVLRSRRGTKASMCAPSRIENRAPRASPPTGGAPSNSLHSRNPRDRHHPRRSPIRLSYSFTSLIIARGRLSYYWHTVTGKATRQRGNAILFLRNWIFIE